MSEPHIFFSEVNERQGVFHRRAFLMGGLAGAGLAALGGRLAYLQLVQAQRYQKLAAGNQFNFQLVPPPRGLILDRNGVSLASNRPNFRLLVAREDGMDVDETVDELAKLVPLEPERIERLKKDIKRAPKKQPVAVMEDMSWEEFSRINIREPELPGVTADMGEVRVYPYGGAFAHVIGYVAERKPLLDKALSGTFPPGSTFKTMVALAALENGFNPSQTYTCHGVFPFGNHVFHCDKSHGTLDLHGAIVTSCDVYFYQAALSCGPDKIATVARAFGLGQIFDIGIEGQKRGVVPDREWKKQRFAKQGPQAQIWYQGETPSIGIGQGYVNVNPLQLCVMVSRLANGQKALVPRLVKSVGGVDQPSGAAVPDLPVSHDHIQLVRQAMADVTKTGTAAASGDLGLGPIMMAGKTGTAQSHTYAAGARTSRNLGWALRDHAWFVAFAPYDDPRYAISVLVEHGGFGAAAAAPRAREIMRTTLLKDPEIVRRIEASGQEIAAAAPKVDVGAVDEAAPAAEPTLIGPHT